MRECLITICIRVAVRSWLCYLRFKDIGPGFADEL